MIKQKKRWKPIQIKIEPWKIEESQLDAIQLNIENTLQLQSPLTNKAQNNSHSSFQIYKSNLKKRSYQLSNKKIQKISASSMSLTPTVSVSKNATTVDYIKENQKKIQFYSRKSSIQDPQSTDTSVFVPINGHPCTILRKPKINITHIGYSQDFCHSFEQSIEQTKRIRKRNFTYQDSVTDTTDIRHRPSTGIIQTRRQHQQNDIIKSQYYKTSNHLQKVLKIKQKLRQKTKKKIEEKQGKKVFLFKENQKQDKSEQKGRFRVLSQHQREKRLSIRSLHTKQNHLKTDHTSKNPNFLQNNQLSVYGGSILI